MAKNCQMDEPELLKLVLRLARGKRSEGWAYRTLIGEKVGTSVHRD